MKGYKPVELSNKKESSFCLELGIKIHSEEGGENNDTGNNENSSKNS